MKRTFIIEGFPQYFGDAVSWHEGEAIPALLDMKGKNQIGKSIDIMGGVQKWDNQTFKVVDVDGTIGRLFQFGKPITAEIGQITTNPINTPADTATTPQDLTVVNDTHRTLSAVSNQTAGWVVSTMPDITANWTVLTWVKWAAETGKNRIFNNGGISINFDTTHLYIKINGSTRADIYQSIAGAWHRLGFRYDGTNCSIWLDGVSIASGVAAVAAATSATAEFWSAYTDDAEIANFKVYGKALTDAQMLSDFSGVPVAGPVYDWQGRHTSHGITIVDSSDSRLHSTCTGGDTTRSFLPGDLLYLPLDTARVAALDVSSNVYPCQRQIYSCLEGGWFAYYQSEKLFDSDGNPLNPYTAEFGFRPWFYSGRVCAYYVDDQLVYIGRIKDIEQSGKMWSIETVDFLSFLTEGIGKFAANIAVTNQWNIEECFFKTIAGTDIEIAENTTPIAAGQSLSEYLNGATFSPSGTGQRLHWSDAYGWVIYNSGGGWNIEKSKYVTPFVDAFASGKETLGTCFPGGGPVAAQCLLPDGNPYQSAIIANRYGLATFAIQWDSDLSGLLNCFLKCGKYFLQVTTYSNANKTITVRAFDEDMKPVTAWGVVDAGTRVRLNLAPMMSSGNFRVAIWAILTSTGDRNNNGFYDYFPGWAGCGLPAALIDDVNSSLMPFESDITPNFEDGNIEADLQALGYALVFKGGKFLVQKVEPPLIAKLTTPVINDAARGIGSLNPLKWGYFSPLNSITYTTGSGDVTVNAYQSTLMMTADRRNKAFKTFCKMILSDTERLTWLSTNMKRLKWLTNYAPSLELTLPNHTLNLLDVVSVQLTGGAGQGRYGIDCTALVTAIKDDYKVTITLNTQGSAMSYVPSFEIASYTGTAITTNLSDCLALLDYFVLPLDVQIINHQGAVLTAATHINAVVDANHLTLANAPTYTQTDDIGIICLPEWTAAALADQAAYIWAADAAGVMSDATAGKVIP